MTYRTIAGAVLGLLMLGLAPQAGVAAEATIAVQTETSSLDPHFAVIGANQQIALHIFDPLVGSDAHMHPEPALALSWALVEPTVWEFKLRPGVHFHDGTPLTAADVKASIDRMPTVPNSPAPFTRLAAVLAGTEVVDDLTIRLRTKGFDATIPLYAMSIYVIPAKLAQASTADFNSGKAAIGTGPYKVVAWQPGQRLVLDRNPGWWGPAPAFDRVVIKPIANDAARVSALLAGDVQLIDQVPTADMARLRDGATTRLWTADSSRLIYLGLEQERPAAPGVTDKAGKPLDRNPFQDARVRQALSLAINRAAIVQRIMGGAGSPAGQLVPEGMTGYAPDLKPDPYDPAKAKALLAEAGYPDGFGLVLSTPVNRYPNDEKVAQAVAQMFARIGVDAKVNGVPSNVFFAQAGKRSFGMFLIGFGTSTGDSAIGLNQVLGTWDGSGFGALNRGRYSNPAFDQLLREAAGATDPAAREDKLRAAARLGFRDHGLIPLYFQANLWATAKGYAYAPRVDEATLATELRPAP